MPITIGSKLEHYEVTGTLGAGGMGEVYRARDTKLRRDVALKILPIPFARDPDRLARFEREAQSLAALNHPRIAAIYGLGQAEGTRFLVLELVEGPTLAERLSAGRMDVGEALRIATEIAEAMEASHERGVIHRDLKPANVKVTSDGHVKVLDFGLAKALGDPELAQDPAHSPTLTMRETQAGIVVGTAAYMSPEQASGKPVDKRTDIWSFGVVLYEMLAGRRAFEGKSVSHILVHVLEQEPDWSALPPLPPGIRELLERCLQKDPSNRLRDIGDIRVLLLAAITRPVVAQAQALPGRLMHRRSFLAQSAVGAAVVGAAAVGGIYYFRREAPAPALDSTRFEITRPQGTNSNEVLALSPNGRMVAFLASKPGQSLQLWLWFRETNTFRPIEGSQTAGGFIFWSPDSKHIVFPAAGKLQRIDIAGASPQPLCPLTGVLLGGFWTPDNRIVFASLWSGSVLQMVPAAGGTAVPVTVLEKNEQYQADLSPCLLPDGRRFLYTRGGLAGRNLHLGLLDAPVDANPGEPLVTDVARAVYASSPDPAVGYLLYIRGLLGPTSAGTLLAQRISTRDWTLSGEAVPIVDRVFTVSFSVSEDSTLVYTLGGASTPNLGALPGLVHGQLTWLDRKGSPLRKVGEPGWYRTAALSPDETKIALEVVDPQIQNMDVYLLEASTGNGTRFSFSASRDYTPVWSFDGSKILYASERPDGVEWYLKPATGPAEEVLAFKALQPGAPVSWTRDGIALYSDFAAPSEIRAVNLEVPLAERKPLLVASSEGNDIHPRLSPDDKFIVYVSDESGRNEIWVRPLNPASFGTPSSTKWHVSKNGAQAGGAIWRGNEIFFISTDFKMMSVEVTTQPTFEVKGAARELFPVSAGLLFFDVSKDGKRFLMPVPTGTEAAQSPFQVVLNWTALLEK